MLDSTTRLPDRLRACDRERNRYALCAVILLVAATCVAFGQSPAMPQPAAQSPEASLGSAQVHPGYRLELVAAEPMVADPVAIDWGPDGRLWVVEMADYPYGLDGNNEPGGRVRYLEDTDGDGRYDRSVLFLEGIPFPTAVMPWRDGVLVAAAPEIFFAQDTNGDGQADHRQALYRGFMEGNQQLRVNGLRYGLDHWVYCAGGGHHAGFGEDNTILALSTRASIPLGSRDFRFQPDTQALVPQSGPSQFGRVRNDWGDWFGVQNSHPLWHYVLENEVLERNRHGRYGDVRNQLRTPINPAVFPRSSMQKRYHSFQQSGHFTSACGPCIYRDEWLFRNSGVTHAFTCEPFHNVVQHHELIEDGVSFRGQRAATTAQYDFFASADRWCRPVMARTGPDGALWIVDMYRYMIEHPDWLPPEGREELKPYYRSGEGMGRIYRVVRSEDSSRPIPQLASLSDAELVAQLSHRNGPLRDLAQRMLIHRQADAQHERLRTLLLTGDRAQTRLHALAVLCGLALADDDDLLAALRDPHPMIRRFALRSIGSRPTTNGSIRKKILQMADDPSAKVRLQLILVLGDLPGDRAAKVLLETAGRSIHDRYVRAALVSSAPRHAAQLVGQFAQGDMRPKELMATLLEISADQPALAAKLLGRAFAQKEQPLQPHQWLECSSWLRTLKDRGQDPFEWSVAVDGELANAVERLDQLMRQAWQVGLNGELSVDQRAAALSIVPYDRADRRRQHRESLVQLIGPLAPSSLQLAAASVLCEDLDTRTIDALFDAWPSFLPATRAGVLDGFWRQRAAIAALLDRIESGHIDPLELDAVRRDRLIRHPDSSLARRAQHLMASTVAADRREVIQRYRSAMPLKGDAARGRELFVKHCANCHLSGRVGVPSIGPDLKSLTDRSLESLLVSILDPSRVLDPRYMGYHIETRTGHVLFGLITGESGNSLTIRTPEGETRQLVRDHIAHLESSKRSFMPDGLEAELDAQAMADVIAHVQQLR